MDSLAHDDEQELLSIAKLTAARDVATAVLEGRCALSPPLLDALARLIMASADHARAAS